MPSQWFATWRVRWMRIKRLAELGLSGVLLLIGALLVVALIPALPSVVTNALAGDIHAIKTLLVCTAGIAVCVLQWRWRTAIYPQLRRDACRRAVDEG